MVKMENKTILDLESKIIFFKNRLEKLKFNKEQALINKEYDTYYLYKGSCEEIKCFLIDLEIIYLNIICN